MEGLKELQETFNSLKQAFEEVETKVIELFGKHEEIVEKPKGWFKPEMDETYWYIDDYDEVNDDNYEGHIIDNVRIARHNCFRSEGEAKEYLRYKTALREAEKPFDMSRDNFRMYYSFTSKRICLEPNRYTKDQGATYLGTDEEVAQEFLDKWKKQILKYEFNIWED